MTNKLPPHHPTRREIWLHNSFLRHTAMLNHHMKAIINSITATEETVQLAGKIQQDGFKLSRLLKTRKDQQS